MSKTSIRDELKFAINNKTKPISSLGWLEEIALQAGIIQNTVHPCIKTPHIVVFAADHGIAATGLVNPYPQEVTGQMVLNFMKGGAAINVFCRQNRIRLKVIDAGVNYDFNGFYDENFINGKIAHGTRDYTIGPAMTGEQANAAVEKGKEIVHQIYSGTGCNCIGFGEMGIGNSSSAALIMSAILNLPVEDCVGRGTGANEKQLRIKIETLKKVHEVHQLCESGLSPLKLLCRIGGFEIAQMAGAYLQSFEEKMIIVVDGFIGTAALLIAQQINPLVLNNCIFAHCSEEKGHLAMLSHLRAKPLLNLGMRLGEGTGAALAIPLIQSAVNFLNEMSSFESAAVSKIIQ